MKKIILLSLLAISTLTGCTDNVRSKAWGGTSTVELPKGQKLINVTWKGSQLWYLTRPAKAGETPESIAFKEKSDMGILEGTVIFKEQ